MQKNRFYKGILFAAIPFVLLFAVFIIIGQNAFSGIALVLFFVALAVGVRGSEKLKGYSYSLWIFAAVTVSMYFPEYFLGVGNFQFKKLIIPLLQIIMFGMGSQMALSDLTNVIKMPKGVIAGVICQYTIMPFLGITIAMSFGFPPEIAAGVILIGSSPSGLASNVMSYIARANLALSVTITAITTIISPFMTPMLMKLLAGELVEVNFWKMMLDIFNMVILPIVAGLIFNMVAYRNVKGRAWVLQLLAYLAIIVLKNMISMNAEETTGAALIQKLATDVIWFVALPALAAVAFHFFAKGDKAYLDKGLAFVSMAGIAVIITIITAAGRDSLLEVGLLLILACFIHNTFGYGLGYVVARFLLRMPEKDCRTIAFEVGMQNGGLASGLALQMGKVATVGLAPAVFGPLMNITGSTLATWWRSRTKEEKVEK
jgi:BASS family bile acid:Na+ symporter